MKRIPNKVQKWLARIALAIMIILGGAGILDIADFNDSFQHNSNPYYFYILIVLIILICAVLIIGILKFIHWLIKKAEIKFP